MQTGTMLMKGPLGNTGIVFKMSTCGSCKSTIKNILYASKDLA